MSFTLSPSWDGRPSCCLFMVVSSVVKDNEKVNDKNGELGIFSNESLCLNLKIIFFNQSLNQKKK